MRLQQSSSVSSPRLQQDVCRIISSSACEVFFSSCGARPASYSRPTTVSIRRLTRLYRPAYECVYTSAGSDHRVDTGRETIYSSTAREQWIQRITFAAETNAACSRGSADRQTHRCRASQYLLRSLKGGEGNQYVTMIQFFIKLSHTKTADF